ncbi:hypothetical protein [Actinophytocola sp.]|uniref:hypothetical protein n=1 Tax=Actinophytocola sp. TaxID=1872138 RepID=UPI00389AA657
MGDDPTRFPHARGLRAYAGAAPITWASSTSVINWTTPTSRPAISPRLPLSWLPGCGHAGLATISTSRGRALRPSGGWNGGCRLYGLPDMTTKNWLLALASRREEGPPRVAGVPEQRKAVVGHGVKEDDQGRQVLIAQAERPSDLQRAVVGGAEGRQQVPVVWVGDDLTGVGEAAVAVAEQPVRADFHSIPERRKVGDDVPQRSLESDDNENPHLRVREPSEKPLQGRVFPLRAGAQRPARADDVVGDDEPLRRFVVKVRPRFLRFLQVQLGEATPVALVFEGVRDARAAGAELLPPAERHPAVGRNPGRCDEMAESAVELVRPDVVLLCD